MLNPLASRVRTSYRASAAGLEIPSATPSLRFRGCGPVSIQSSASSAALGAPAPAGLTAGAHAVATPTATISTADDTRNIADEPSKDRARRAGVHWTRFAGDH